MFVALERKFNEIILFISAKVSSVVLFNQNNDKNVWNGIKIKRFVDCLQDNIKSVIDVFTPF